MRWDLENLKKQPGLTVFNEKRFDELIAFLNIQEPVEFLINQCGMMKQYAQNATSLCKCDASMETYCIFALKRY